MKNNKKTVIPTSIPIPLPVKEKIYDNAIKSYLYLNNNKVTNNAVTSIKITNSPIAFANYYNFPTQQNSDVKPKIGIISFGGSYFTADLDYYWRNILKLNVI